MAIRSAWSPRKHPWPSILTRRELWSPRPSTPICSNTSESLTTKKRKPNEYFLLLLASNILVYLIFCGFVFVFLFKVNNSNNNKKTKFSHFCFNNPMFEFFKIHLKRIKLNKTKTFLIFT